MTDDINKVSWCNVCDDCQRHPCICMVGGAETRISDTTLVDTTAKPRYNCPTEAHDGEE